MRQEVEEVITALIEQDEPDFDQIDFGEPRLAPKEDMVAAITIDYDDSVATSDVCLDVGVNDFQVIEDVEPDKADVWFSSVEDMMKVTSALEKQGIPYSMRSVPEGESVEEQEEPSFDQVDFGEPESALTYSASGAVGWMYFPDLELNPDVGLPPLRLPYEVLWDVNAAQYVARRGRRGFAVAQATRLRDLMQRVRRGLYTLPSVRQTGFGEVRLDGGEIVREMESVEEEGT